jgi:hypothetical protein
MRYGPYPGSWLTNDIVITDVQNPNFDLEKLLLKVAKENP